MEDEPDIVEYPDSDGEVVEPTVDSNDIPKDAVWLDASQHVHLFDLACLHAQRPLTHSKQGKLLQPKGLRSES